MENSEIVIEKEVIKNKSEFTNKEIIDALCKILNNSKIWILLFIMGLLSLGLYVFEILYSDKNTQAWLFCGVFLVLISVFMFFGTPSIMKNSNSNFKDGVLYEFEFYDNEFIVNTRLSGQKSIMTIEYSSIHRAVISNNYLAIYISKGQCLILKLDCFNSIEDKNKVLELFNLKRK